MLLDQGTAGDGSSRVPIHGVTPESLPARLDSLGGSAAGWAAACGFKADAGQVLLIPGEGGRVAAALFGVEAATARHIDPFLAGKLATALPEGEYRLADGFADPYLAGLGFELSAYRFTRFRTPGPPGPRLEAPAGADAARIDLVAGAIALGRDLINRPANDLGPDALEAAVLDLAERHGARASVVRGEELERDFPMVHAVGRAAAQAPRLAEFVWGDEAAPKITLVGKGVCFDTGGLDIKPSSSMLLMKKDMGGAAAALALAAMVMGTGLPVRLRVIVPIVENAIAGDAFRPGDVLRSRKGITVEIGNTDAEGRLILADALALADEEAPEALFDFATLTGAARVALGPELPPFFTMDEELADAIARHARAANDPLWRMPLWDPYDQLLKSKVADVNNISGGPFAGCITAALFLRRFVDATKSWAHFDVFGWNPATRPGHPEGGEVMAAHALFDMLAACYGTTA